MYYECVICETLNSVRRFSCKHCGTIPAMYSVTKRPAKQDNHFTEVIRAAGAITYRSSHARVYLRRVPDTYYATE